MNPQTLTRQAIRRAQREARKRGRALTKEEVLKLRVQTANPWARVFFVTAGLAAAGISALCYSKSGPWWVTGLFVLVGVALIGFGVFGRRDQVERELKKITAERMADAVLTGILDGIA
jgi:fatty acid desaturase